MLPHTTLIFDFSRLPHHVPLVEEAGRKLIKRHGHPADPYLLAGAVKGFLGK